jgi:hypothetical protein
MRGDNHEFLKNGRNIFSAEALDRFLIMRSDLPDGTSSFRGSVPAVVPEMSKVPNAFVRFTAPDTLPLRSTPACRR